MPQMAPIWWLTLMTLFLMSMLTMMSILYFNVFFKKVPIKYITKSYLIWKW
uniref:ATP synthase complex subunit 8 n=1 Tax=Kolla paulula TaxID=700811 RepID=A0A8K1R9I6_9HEMI|nr:ATP synthase F0 subunit 8 [Kolla paulula]